MYLLTICCNLHRVKTIITLVLLSLICSPLGGIHLHFAGGEGFSGVHAVHVHDSDHHADEADGSIAKMLTSLANFLIVAASLLALLFVYQRAGTIEPIPFYDEHYPDKPGDRQLRLRAPPYFR